MRFYFEAIFTEWLINRLSIMSDWLNWTNEWMNEWKYPNRRLGERIIEWPNEWLNDYNYNKEWLQSFYLKLFIHVYNWY